MSPDGNLLVTSAGIDQNNENCCHVFARNNWDEPMFSLPGFKDPVVGSCFSPFFYKLREGENELMSSVKYRMLFCLITLNR
jgi:hypothetical protein